jgi:LysM repeat protein
VHNVYAAKPYRQFIADANGLIYQATSYANAAGNNQTNAEWYLYAGGKPIGSIKPAVSAGGATQIDVDFNYTPVSAQFPATTPGKYVVAQGDTLQTIALAVFGDAALWYLIADANGIRDNSGLRVGQQLSIPNRITNLHNNYQTFKVYSPGQVIGDTTPTLPDPPPPPQPSGGKKGCGVIGMILIIIVAIVVTIFTAGAALAVIAPAATTGMTVMGAGMAALAGSMGAAGLAAAVVGAAVGSIVSQGFAMAIGHQEKFSWGQVAVSAVGAGVTAGLGGGALGSIQNTAARVAVSAVISNAVSQGVAIAVGVQDKFNWRSLAVAAVAAPLTQAIGEGMFNETPTGADYADWGNKAGALQIPNAFARALGETGTAFVRGFVSGVVTQVVRKEIYGQGKVDYRGIAADSFGNVIANSMVAEIQASETERKWEQVKLEAEIAASQDRDDFELGQAMRAMESGGNANSTAPRDPNTGLPIEIGPSQAGQGDEVFRRLQAIADTAAPRSSIDEDWEPTLLANGRGQTDVPVGSDRRAGQYAFDNDDPNQAVRGRALVRGTERIHGENALSNLKNSARQAALEMGLRAEPGSIAEYWAAAGIALSEAIPTTTGELAINMAAGPIGRAAGWGLVQLNKLPVAGWEMAGTESVSLARMLSGSVDDVPRTTVAGTSAAVTDLLAARQATARSFYESAGWSETRISNHMKGIDFSQPVEVITLHRGTLVDQFQLPGKPVGNYFSPIGTPANVRGMDTTGRVNGLFELRNDVTVLKSTAATITDWAGSGKIYKGGGTQYFAPNQINIVRALGQ